ncbi:MAG: PQQ-binding-like beta-propeller repeat protein [Planctomycetota bacterium]
MLCPVLALLSLAPVQDADEAYTTWTRFRGPNGSGVLEGAELPAALDPESNLRWRTPLPAGHSSPVLWKGRVYLTALDGETLVTLCLDADTGAILWRRAAPRPRTVKVDGRNHPASPTPVVGPEGVFVFFPEYGVLAYDHLSEELWRVPLGPFDNVYGMGASPILHEGRVLLACDQSLGSYFVALDAGTGEELWRADRPKARSGHCTPILCPLDTTKDGVDIEVLLPGSFYLDAYDLKTGEVRWSAGGLSFEMKSVPILWDDLVLTNGYGSPMNQPGNQITPPSFAEVVAERDADGDGAISREEMPQTRAAAWFDFVDLDRSGGLDERDWAYLEQALASLNGLLAFRLGGGAGGEEPIAWSYRRSVPQLPSPVIHRETLYVLADAGGLVTTFRPGTGELIEKGRLDDANDTFYASPVAGDGKVYFVSEHGLAVVLSAGGGFDPLWAGDLGENVYATPALAPGRVYLRTTEALHCFEAKD